MGVTLNVQEYASKVCGKPEWLVVTILKSRPGGGIFCFYEQLPIPGMVLAASRYCSDCADRSTNLLSRFIMQSSGCALTHGRRQDEAVNC